MSLRRLFAFSAVLGVIACGRCETMASEAGPPASTRAATWSFYRRFKASIGYHFSSGDYGTSDTTDIHYVPLVLTAEIDRFIVQGTIPYLRIDGPAGVIEGPAGPIDTRGKADGLGDIVARGSYLLPRGYDWRPWVPFLGLAGIVKFPTASRGDGLGTGEFDFGLESELTWVLGKLVPFASVGYRFLGDPPGANLHDVVTASGGGQYRIVDAVNAGLLLDYRQASSSSAGDRLEIVPFGSWRFIPPWSLDLYASAGLADGSPDAGVGLQLGYTW